jgi:hypothetical protein
MSEQERITEISREDKRRQKAALTVLKDSKIKGAWYDADKTQYFTNTYVAFALRNPIPGLQDYEGDNNNNKMIQDLFKKYATESFYYEEITDLNVNEIKANLKEAKKEVKRLKDQTDLDYTCSLFKNAKARFIHENEYRKWGCNAVFLLLAIDILGENTLLKLPLKESKTIGYLESENGVALICPVNLNNY